MASQNKVCIICILQLNDTTHYTGIASDLKKRLKDHRAGSVFSTKGKLPVSLIFYCAFHSKAKAAEFEQYLKTGSGQAFRNRYLIEKS